MLSKRFYYLNNCLIIVGSTLAYDFIADYVKQTVDILNKNNIVIVFLWGNALSVKELLRQRSKRKQSFRLIYRQDKVTLYNPIHFLPFRRFEVIRNINMLINVSILNIYILLKKYLRKKKLVWIFNYELYNFPKIIGNSFISLYDCIELSTSIENKKNQEIKKKEKILLDRVDLVFVNSLTLKKLFSKYSPILVPQGFDSNTFNHYNERRTAIKVLPNLEGKIIIGYVGGINYRLDFKLLIDLAKSFENYSFVFVGQKQIHPKEDNFFNTNQWISRLFSHKNVYLVEEQPKKYIPQIIAQFDICLIPYAIQIKFNKYCYPMKLFEYFYMGKPVISSPILEIKKYSDLVQIASTVGEWQDAINRLLAANWSKKKKKIQRRLALDNSWGKKIAAIDSAIYNYLNF